MSFRSSAIGGALAGRSWSTYGTTIAFISILCAAVVGHDLLRTWEDRTRQIESARRQVANLAWAAEQHAETAFLLAGTALTGLAERVETDGTGPAQEERLRRLLVLRQASVPVLSNQGIIDAKGDLIADAGPRGPRINLSDRPYFQYHLAHADGGLHVSGILRSRSTGKWTIAVSQRVNRGDGALAAIVSAAVDVTFFRTFYSTLDLGRDGSVTLVRDDGTVLVRHPSFEPADGTSPRTKERFRAVFSKAPSGTSEAVSSLDGVERIYAWRGVPGYPLFVFVALGKDERLAAWRIGAGEHLLATAATVALLAFGGIRLVVHVRRLTRAELATAAATTAARTSAERYRLIADNASDMVVTVDMRYVRRYVSPGCRELLGYEPEELVGDSSVPLCHPDDAALIAECQRDIAAGRDRDILTWRARHRDGHWVLVEASIRLIRDPDSGAPVEICAALRDVTQRVATQTALLESRRELERTNADLRDMTVRNLTSQYARGLLEASLDPLLTISPEGKITDVNEATIKVTGKSRDALVGTDFSDYFTEPERAREAYLRVFASGAITDYPLTIRHQNESLTEVLYNASVYEDADGNVLGVFAAARDVTARLIAEREIAERQGEERERLAELEQFQRLTVGRELKMIDLKKEILELKARVPAGA